MGPVMSFHAPVGWSVAVFVVVLAAFVAALVVGVYVASRALGGAAGAAALRRAVLVACGAAVWLGALGAVVRSGALEGSPGRLPLFFLAANAMGIALALSPVGRWLASGLPLAALVGFQALRLPLEIVLHDWARQGSIPETMTWSGSNFDVVTGALALGTAVFAPRSRALAWVVNVVGLALLVNVMRVAMLSSPAPFGWHLPNPLLLPLHLPYALIVPVCVAGALLGHVVLTRSLLGLGEQRVASWRVAS